MLAPEERFDPNRYFEVFDRLLKAVTSLQKEFWEAMGKPKAQRRPTLAKEYMDTATAMLETLDKLSGSVAAAINHQDATIDQLLAIKQIAARSARTSSMRFCTP